MVHRAPSRDLRTLIKAHKATYAAFGKAIQERDEERALLAVCPYPAVREGDRRAKARYLLRIEGRGELDLAEHMQALLRSTMWKG
jgi:hypothetical protein